MDEPVVDDYWAAEALPARPRRATAATVLVIGAALGLVAGLVLALWSGWRPLSDVNEVSYLEITVGSVSPESDRLCWSEEPDRRDADHRCAILAIDPHLTVPQPGEVVTVALTRLLTPDGSERQQVVWISQPAAAEAGAGTS